MLVSKLHCGTSKTMQLVPVHLGLPFQVVLEVPLCNLLTSMCDFVPCDWIMQRAYCYCPHQPNVDNPPDHGTINGLLNPGETILCQTLWETIDKCIHL